MFTNPLFRERALIRRAQPEPLDDLLRVTAPHEWVLLAGIAVALAAAVAWSAFAGVERTVAHGGTLVRPGVRHTLAAAASGIVTEVAAEVGDRVEAGQTIARLRLPELDWRQRLAQARVAALESGAAAGAGTRAEETADDPTAAAWRAVALASARAELIEVAALGAAGAEVVSPHGGEVSASSLVVGRAVEAGEAVAEIRAGERHVPEAIAFIPQGERRIEVGMAARVAVPSADGSRVYPARVIAIAAAEPLPARAAGAEGAAARTVSGAGRVVRLALEGGEGPQAPDGAPCRIEIILARTSPLGLLIAAGRRAG